MEPSRQAERFAKRQKEKARWRKLNPTRKLVTIVGGDGSERQIWFSLGQTKTQKPAPPNCKYQRKLLGIDQ